MLDQRTHSAYSSVTLGSGGHRAAITRGTIILAGVARFLVWSHDDTEMSCVPLNRAGGVVFGRSLQRVRKTGAIVVGVADPGTLARARHSVADLPAKAVATVNARAAVSSLEELARGAYVRHRGTEFYADDQTAEGCYWVRPRTGT